MAVAAPRPPRPAARGGGDEQTAALVEPDAHTTISLDGFAETSRSVFRKLPGCFAEAGDTIKRFAMTGILPGLLCTQNLRLVTHAHSLFGVPRPSGRRGMWPLVGLVDTGHAKEALGLEGGGEPAPTLRSQGRPGRGNRQAVCFHRQGSCCNSLK